MKYTLISFLLSLLLPFISSCQEGGNLNAVNFNTELIYEPKSWYAYGPFAFDTLRQSPETTYFNRDLDVYNVNEDSITIQNLKRLSKTNIPSRILTGKNVTHRLSKYILDYKNKSNFYLATTMESSQERDVWFLFDGATNCKVWINGKKLYETRGRKNET